MNVKRLFLLVLCTLIIFTAVISPTARTYAASGDYDYSREGSYFNTVFTSADILELIGYELSDGERAYLDAYGSLNVRYETVTTQEISVITVDGVTRVSARVYTYVGENGEIVTWTPVSASVGGEDKMLSLADGVLCAEFEGVDVTDEAVNVKYVMNTVAIGAEDVNEIVNVAFGDAEALKKEIGAYVEHADEISEYFSNLALYRKYVSDKLVYDQKKSEYEKYLADTRIYDEELTRYGAYLLELEEYNRIKDNNDAYPDNYAKYEADLAKYNKYLSDLDLAAAQLKMLNDALMNKVTYLNRQLYACIFADLVDEVVGRKDELTKIGAKKSDIDSCAVATANIRAILKPEGGKAYVELETDEEKYEFYVNNYEGLRDNIIKLTQSLYGIYSNDSVRITMHAASAILNRPDYTEKLSIFIAQLIYFSNALSTEPVMSADGKTVLDSSITFSYKDAAGVDRSKVKITDLLEGNIFVEDIENPVPVSLVEVSEPTPPTLLELPTPPVEVAKPTEPAVVPDPGRAPEEILEPARPVYAPATPERLEIVNNEIYALLISDLDSGLLDGEREPLTEDVLFTPAVTLKKNIASADMVNVTFLDESGAVITTIGAEKGSAVNFTDELPAKAEDVSATYIFGSWVTASGDSYDLSSVSEDVILYPSFIPVYKEYGTVDKGMPYLDVRLTGHTLATLPVAHFLDVAKDSHLGILITAENVTLTIPYTAVLELSASRADRLDVFVDTSLLGSYTFSMYAYDSTGHLVPHVFGISVSIPCTDETFARDSVLSYFTEDGATQVFKSYSSGMITFNANTRTNYTFVLRYSISAGAGLSGRVSAPSDAIPGETVRLELSVAEGVRAELYYVLLSDLSKHVIDGDSFVMPYGNIHLGATFTELEYTVRFVSDGKVLSERTYKHGETVKVPNDPTKLSDGEYTYTFVGWSPEVSTANGDVTYVALFESSLIPAKDEKVSLFNVIFYSGLSVFILGVLALTVLILNKKGVINVRGVLNAVKQKLTRVGDKGKGDKDGTEKDNG